MTDGDGEKLPLQGDGETILVEVELEGSWRLLLRGRDTVFSRARFPDGSKAGVRLHMLDPVEGRPRNGIIEVRTGEVPKGLTLGDVIELTAGGVLQLRCVVAEP